MNIKNRTVRVESVKNKALLADQCEVAVSFLSRLKGLIGTKTLEEGRGIFISPCNDIHMWFMSIPIDVVFVVGVTPVVYQVTSVHRGIRPWRLLPLWDRKASDTLELPVGTIERCQVMPGDRLCID